MHTAKSLRHAAAHLCSSLFLSLLVGMMLVTAGCASAQEKSASDKLKVVIQVSDDNPKLWNLVLNNVKNIQDDLGAANVDIEVVAYGPGLGILKLDSAVNSRVASAISGGAKLIACENTLRNQKLERADLISGVGYVKAGVVHLIQRQKDGWAYIRP